MRPGIPPPASRLLSLLAVVGIAVVGACSAGLSVETKAVSGPGSAADDGSKESVPDSLSSQMVTDPGGGIDSSDAAAAAALAVSWTHYDVRFVGSTPGEEPDRFMNESVDLISGNLHVVLSTTTDDDDGIVEGIRVADEYYVRGPDVSSIGGEDPEQWYQVDEFSFDRLVGSTAVPLNQILVHLVEIGDPAEVATGRWSVDLTRFSARMEGRDEETVNPSGDPEDRVVVEMLGNSETEVRFRLTVPANRSGPDPTEIEIQLQPSSAIYEAPNDIVVLDAAPSTARSAPEIDPRSLIVPDEDGVTLTVVRYLSDDDLRLSFEENGRIVLVSDRSVFATAADHTAWTVPPAVIAERVDWLVESTLVEHPEANLQFGTADGSGYSISYGQGFVIDVHGPEEVLGLTDAQNERRRIFHSLFSRLADVATIESVALTGPEPYVPEAMIVTPRQPNSPVNATWPLDVSPADLVPPGEKRFCLLGDDAAAVWAAMGDLTVSDMVVDVDGEAWNILIYPGSPGYLTNRHLCPDQ